MTDQFLPCLLAMGYGAGIGAVAVSIRLEFVYRGAKLESFPEFLFYVAASCLWPLAIVSWLFRRRSR